jgi:hypothetical protein
MQPERLVCGDTIEYRLRNGRLHREDGPAIVSGHHKLWAINGFTHREDGPAIEYYDGDKVWYARGKMHRLDGPAMEFDGAKFWYVNHCEVKKAGFKSALALTKYMRIKYAA